jgi:hypothetical protein
MLNEQLISLLNSVDRRELARTCREVEESILVEIRGNIFTLQAGCRYAAMNLVRKMELPGYKQLHPGLTAPILQPRRKRATREPLSGAQWAAITEKLEQRLKMKFITLKPVSKVVFEDDPDLERARRVPILAKRWAKIEEALIRDQALRKGPYAKRIYCPELEMTFESARQAAKFLSEKIGRPVQPSDVRTCIKRGTRRAGCSWQVASSTGQIQSSGRERPVFCVERPEVSPFPSLTAAAQYADVSTTKMAEAINQGRKINGLTFRWHQKAARPVKAQAQLQTLFG